MSMDLLLASALALYLLVAVMWAGMRGHDDRQGPRTRTMRRLLAATGVAYLVVASRATAAVFSAVLRAWPQ